jgi:hypothetical protein
MVFEDRLAIRLTIATIERLVGFRREQIGSRRERRSDLRGG